ncbi:GerAB/ArcD/ProY family transporter [Paenibacillus sp. D2_2]|uniref:GerAB/ArcD/ProY family transporter n=1 Tax=Paenibacillus sp. D2_2 TaxID=3073092 RepID=UPI002815EB70|nr:GerAB/ArcD/ProY family transporter [Paenibacillus sp. D2_2]WMT43041.1 GerAB/ArcD/ProY family transporter [Paenibacillus sp. D2_2]
MKINSLPNKNLQFHAFLLSLIICNFQIGVGIFNFQRPINKLAGHYAWMSVLLAGIVTHLVIWLIIRMLRKYESSDLFGIHYDIFGKGIGMTLNLIYMLYYLAVSAIIIRNYVEVLQTWIFPDISSWLVILLLSILTVYVGNGGIRVIVGLCVIGFIIILITSLLFYYPLKYAIWSHLLPLYTDEPLKVIQGSLQMAFSLAGFEIIMLLYPFVRNKQQAQMHVQLGAGFTNLIYLVLMLISTVYFSSCQLEKSIWPSINMLKIIKYPFLERLEFIVISIWMVIVLTGIAISTWAISRGCKRMWNSNPKAIMIIVMTLIFVISYNIEEHTKINQVNHWINVFNIILSYIYPLILALIAGIVLSIRQRRKSAGGDSK